MIEAKSTEVEAQPVGDGKLEQELNRAIREAAPDVVKQVIAKAMEGSYLHAKFLFELAGIDLRQSAQEEGESGESLAQYLLRELRESVQESQPERVG